MTAEAGESATRVSVAGTARLLITRAGISMILRVAGVALAYASNILLSRMLGLHDYGLFVILIGWVSVLGVPTRLGFDASVLRYGTVYRQEANWPALRALALVATLSVGGATLLLSILMSFVGAHFGVGGGDLLCAAALMMATSLLGLYSAFILSAGSVFGSQFFDQALRPCLLVVALTVASILTGPRIGVGEALAFSVLAAWGALIGLVIHLANRLRRCFDVTSDFSGARNWFRVSLPLLLITGIQELLNQMQVILLGAFAEARAAGLFAAAWRLASLISFGLSALGVVCGPLIASAYHRSDFRELGRVAGLAARIALAFAVPSAIVIALAGPWLLGLFGTEFRAAYPALLILVGGALVNAFTGVVVYLMTLTGRERQALIIFAATLGGSVFLNVLLIPRWGAEGAAIASATSTILWNFAMLAYVWRFTGINASALGSLEAVGRR